MAFDRLHGACIFLFTAFTWDMVSSWQRNWPGKSLQSSGVTYPSFSDKRPKPQAIASIDIHKHPLVTGKPRPPKIYECPRCHQKFGHPRSIYRHRKACEGKFDFRCQQCGKSFYRLDSLKTHCQKHAAGYQLPSGMSEMNLSNPDEDSWSWVRLKSICNSHRLMLKH